MGGHVADERTHGCVSRARLHRASAAELRWRRMWRILIGTGVANARMPRRMGARVEEYTRVFPSAWFMMSSESPKMDKGLAGKWARAQEMLRSKASASITL